MVLVKIKNKKQGILKGEHLGLNFDDLLQEDQVDDLNDFKLGNVGCEMAMVEGQLCSIPYELYDLPHLKEILSLETWNSCLTEEERFSLSAFLPDMDQRTFWMTLIELLSGKNMFFGSPLTVLFERMKAGLCPPNVSRLREGLSFLQKRAFYHFLRLYHEKMTRTFSDMKVAWSKCRPDTSVEERVDIWNSHKNHWCLTVVDRNTFSEVGNSFEKSYLKEIFEPVPKRVKFPPVNNPPSSRRGVLKMKPKSAVMYSNQAEMVSKRAPKGVLKVAPRDPPSLMQEPQKVSSRQEQSASAYSLGFQSCKSTLPFSLPNCRPDAETYCRHLYQLDGNGRSYESFEPPNCVIDRQRLDHLNSSSIEPGGHFQSSVKRIKHAKDPTLIGNTHVQEEADSFVKNPNALKKYSRRTSLRGVYPDRDSHQKTAQQKEQFYYDSRDQQMEVLLSAHVPFHSITSNIISTISNLGISQKQMLPRQVDLLEVYKFANEGRLQQPFDGPSVSKGLRDDLSLPITYKRRKDFSRANLLDASNPLTEVVSLGEKS